MSDMIDRLDEIAGEAGELSEERLASSVVNARLAAEVRQGVRRRRLVTAALTFAVVALGVAAAVVVPQFQRPTPIQPATDVRVPVVTDEGLITYDDGSMKVLNQHGVAVDVPAPEEGAPVFQLQSIPEACAVDAKDLRQGWTTQFTNAFQVMTFGRPLLLNETGYHVLAQGQRVELSHDWRKSSFAFSVDVDPAIASHVVMTVSTYVLAPDGRVAFVGSQMESQPAIEYSGDKAAGTYTATLTTRGLRTFDECNGVSTLVNPATSSAVVQYLTANVFLNDGHGHVTPIGSHTSWVTLAKESS